jgi:hypothetical protein
MTLLPSWMTAKSRRHNDVFIHKLQPYSSASCAIKVSVEIMKCLFSRETYFLRRVSGCLEEFSLHETSNLGPDAPTLDNLIASLK